MKYVTRNENETCEAARAFAKTVQAPLVICLTGDLGAGKSVFSRAMIRALCGDDTLTVPSPTFTLLQMYECDTAPIYHFDLYRLDDPEDVLALGWDDAMDEGISLIEWPDKAGGYLPSDCIHIIISIEDAQTRTITIKDTP